MGLFQENKPNQTEEKEYKKLFLSLVKKVFNVKSTAVHEKNIQFLLNEGIYGYRELYYSLLYFEEIVLPTKPKTFTKYNISVVFPFLETGYAYYTNLANMEIELAKLEEKCVFTSPQDSTSIGGFLKLFGLERTIKKFGQKKVLEFWEEVTKDDG